MTSSDGESNELSPTRRPKQGFRSLMTIGDLNGTFGPTCGSHQPWLKRWGAQEVPQRRECRQRHCRGGDDVVGGGELSQRGDDVVGWGEQQALLHSKDQSTILEESFKEHNTLIPLIPSSPSKQKLALAKQLNLRPRQEEVWFQNRRARTKLKQTEVDCEFLQKEVQELRALKLSPQFYMHMTPPTTIQLHRVHDDHHHHNLNLVTAWWWNSAEGGGGRTEICIVSNQDKWYLDHLDVPWQKLYMNEPLTNISTPEQQKIGHWW
uniref:Homeobox domain-containing protein n=1 Tax=Musa acuminata subsp. malaccensis TaxID=214687 RepID=A0A804JBK0_MUSAM